MTRLSLLLLAAIPSCVVSLNPDKWVIDDPTFDVQNKSFTFTYGSIHSEIAASDANYSFYSYECNGTNYYGDGKFVVSTFEKNVTDLILSFEAQPDLISQDTNLYTPGDASGSIGFCVRTGIYAGDEEINFLETQVTIAITLSGDFDLDTVQVTPKDKTATESEQTYQVAAALCGGAGPFNQGAVISVCITPAGEASDDGIIMSTIDSFIWTRDLVTQTAVTSNAAANALSALDTTDDDSFKVSSVLYASFYATSGTVSASGSATMAFPARRLGDKLTDARRRLQEDGIPPTPFDINADVVAATDGPSLVLSTAGGASTSLYMATIIVGLVSAILLA